MNKEYSKELLEKIKGRFPEVEIKIHSPRRTYLRIDRNKVYEFARYLFLELNLRLSTATGIDTRDGIEILYHFSHDPSGTYYNIKTIVPKDDPKIKSLADFLPAANWIEREIHELLGVNFEGHPNLVPLLTAEDWPECVYPLRRDYG